MNIQELIQKVTSVDLPTGAMGGAGIVLLLITLKIAKGFSRRLILLVPSHSWAVLFGGITTNTSDARTRNTKNDDGRI